VQKDYRPQVVRAFAKAGLPDGYRYYLSLLEEEAARIREELAKEADAPYHEAVCQEIVNQFAADDLAIKRLAEKPEAEPLKLNDALQDWLRKKITRLEGDTP